MNQNLPYGFDLLFDIKNVSQLKREIEDHVSSLVDLYELMQNHNVELPDTNKDSVKTYFELVGQIKKSIENVESIYPTIEMYDEPRDRLTFKIVHLLLEKFPNLFKNDQIDEQL